MKIEQREPTRDGGMVRLIWFSAACFWIATWFDRGWITYDTRSGKVERL